MKKLIVLIIMLGILLTACGIPQEDYDAVAQQVTELELDLADVQSELSNSQAEMATRSIELETIIQDNAITLSELQSEYADLTIQYAEEQRLARQRLSEPLWCTDFGRWRALPELTNMRYDSIMDTSTILQAFVSGLPWVLRVQGTHRDTIWNNTQTKIHTIRYREDDGEQYWMHFLVYFDEFGWREGVFWIDEQCWLD